MRKTIFKREIELSFKTFGLTEGQQKDIRNLLFDNPIDVTQQYLLKEEMNSIEVISDSIQSVINDKDFAGDVVSLFTITDDMELPDTLIQQIRGKQPLAVFVGAGVSKLLGIPYMGRISKSSYRLST